MAGETKISRKHKEWRGNITKKRMRTPSLSLYILSPDHGGRGTRPWSPLMIYYIALWTTFLFSYPTAWPWTVTIRRFIEKLAVVRAFKPLHFDYRCPSWALSFWLGCLRPPPSWLKASCLLVTLFSDFSFLTLYFSLILLLWVQEPKGWLECRVLVSSS